MARVRARRAGKTYTCRKCGQPISVGTMYVTAKPYRSARIVAHTGCGIPRSALTTNEGLAMAYDAEDELGTLVADDFDEAGAFAEAIRSVAEQGRDAAQALEDKADEIDEYFPGSYQVDERRDLASEVEQWAEEVSGLADEIEGLEGDKWRDEVAEKMMGDLPALNV